MVICMERDADLHMTHLMPLPLTVSCFSKIQIDFTFPVPAHPVVPEKGPLNRCMFNDSCQINYLEIGYIDLHQIFRVGRTPAVYDQHEITFSIPQGSLPWQPIFVGFIH